MFQVGGKNPPTDQTWLEQFARPVVTALVMQSLQNL